MFSNKVCHAYCIVSTVYMQAHCISCHHQQVRYDWICTCPWNTTLRNPNGLCNTAMSLPAGYQLHKMRLNFQDHIGIVGWQLIWCADGCKDILIIQERPMERGPDENAWDYYSQHQILMMQDLAIKHNDWTLCVKNTPRIPKPKKIKHFILL